MKRLAVLTSGGDAPGMNAVLRAVVRQAEALGIEVMGVRRGFQGLLDGDARLLTTEDVAGMVHRGGTLLLAGRSPAFMEGRHQEEAARRLKAWGVEALVAVGGNGTARGALALSRLGIPVAVVPATIDNDMGGTDRTVGFDTAVNTAVEAMDRLRDTATSHERIFVVEVMGRHSGALALYAGLAAGGDPILIPEAPISLEEVARRLIESRRRGKLYSLVVVAEGAGKGGEVAEALGAMGLSAHVTVLGHIQRGGSPTAQDRILAARLGSRAVEALAQGEKNVLVGVKGDEVHLLDLEEALELPPPYPRKYLELAATLSR